MSTIEREYGFRSDDDLATVAKLPSGKWAISYEGYDLCAKGARTIAELLSAAADECDRLNGDAKPKERRFAFPDDPNGVALSRCGNTFTWHATSGKSWRCSYTAEDFDDLLRRGTFVEITDNPK